ncbi:MAG: hypothetical protein ACI8Q1_003216 [Parvicella sp.]|jgi:hypothetical protein
MKHTFNYLTIGIAILVSSCAGESNDSETSKEKTAEISSETTITIPENESTHFINPPLEGVNVAFHVESINASEGGELFYESGSIVSFPPNAFVDAAGNIITGKVDVKYREFNDPLDIFLSGIPMTYDSAGVQYDFESAGMTEMLAYSEDTPCFVNPESQPEINMVTNDARSKHNLYYLDTVSQQWINQGKDEITDIDQANKALKKEGKSDSKNEEAEPVAPNKPDASKPSFIVTLMPGALPELKSFENVTFEIAKNEKAYKESDSKVAWTSVDVKSNKTEGLYDVTFANASKSVSYICRPVFKGADYDKAFELFEAKKEKYELAKEERIVNDDLLAKSNGAKLEAFSRKNERILKLNELIEGRNIEIEKENEITLAYNLKMDSLEKVYAEEYKDKQGIIDSLAAQRIIKDSIFKASRLKMGDRDLKNEIYRSYVVPKFGVWNCDDPMPRSGIFISAYYFDQNNDSVIVKDVTVITQNFNMARNYTNNKIMITPGFHCMIWTVINKKFAYVSYEEFANKNLDKNDQSASFEMKIMDEEVFSADNIRKYLKF